MGTLLEKALQQQENEAKRSKTIKMLEKKLEEANLLYSLIEGKSFEEGQERHAVGEEIKRIKSFIQSEQEAMQETASSEDVSKVFDQMSRSLR